jgi:hypothetical protein
MGFWQRLISAQDDPHTHPSALHAAPGADLAAAPSPPTSHPQAEAVAHGVSKAEGERVQWTMKRRRPSGVEGRMGYALANGDRAHIA